MSFIISAILLYQADLTKTELVTSNPFKPFVYVWKLPDLRKIFALRSVGYWISAGPFNYLVFSVVTNNFKLSPLMTAWVYSSVGLGGAIATEIIANSINLKKQIGDRNLSIIGHTGLSLMVFAFVKTNNFYLALFFLVFYGIFMSMNATGSQAIRRRLTDNKTFPEIIGAESILGKITDVGVSYIVFLLIERGIGEINDYMIASSILTFIVGLLYFSLKNIKSDK
jgi:predicted MFS family arabinose efflux permease